MKHALNSMNPSLKFLLFTGCMFTMAFFFDPWTPLIFWLSILALQLLLSQIDWKKWLLFMIPFFITAFGYFWTTLVFAEDQPGPVVWSFWMLNVSESQLYHALSLSFRVLAFSSLSLLFAFTTNPTTFIMSLMQQLKLSPKIAYGVLVGYQFLPVLKDEFIQIQQAQRLRGATPEKNILKRLLGVHKVLIPMLAGAVRKAERAAFAMEARGFTGERRSSYFQVITVSKIDGVCVALFLFVLLLSCTNQIWLS